MLANNGVQMTPVLIVTRPAAQSERFARDIAALWTRPLTVIQSPLIGIRLLTPNVGHVDQLVFTSVNGVQAAQHLNIPPGKSAWCVGARTAQAAIDAGFNPLTGPNDANGLVDMILAAQPQGLLAHIRGNHARGDISARLNGSGVDCADIVGYDQPALHLTKAAKEAINADIPVIFPLFSPRTSTILNGEGPFRAQVHVVALSQAVADAVDPALGANITVSRSPDGDAMNDALISALKRVSDVP